MSLFVGESGPQSNTWFIGAPESTFQMAWLVRLFFCRAHGHFRPTDRPHHSICNNRPHLAGAVTQPNNNDTDICQCIWCCLHGRAIVIVHCDRSPISFDEWSLSAEWLPAHTLSRSASVVSLPVDGYCAHSVSPFIVISSLASREAGADHKLWEQHIFRLKKFDSSKNLNILIAVLLFRHCNFIYLPQLFAPILSVWWNAVMWCDAENVLLAFCSGVTSAWIGSSTDNLWGIIGTSCVQVGCPSCRPTSSVKALKETDSADLSLTGPDSFLSWILMCQFTLEGWDAASIHVNDKGKPYLYSALLWGAHL